jgi:hypothetical protein
MLTNKNLNDLIQLTSFLFIFHRFFVNILSIINQHIHISVCIVYNDESLIKIIIVTIYQFQFVLFYIIFYLLLLIKPQIISPISFPKIPSNIYPHKQNINNIYHL